MPVTLKGVPTPPCVVCGAKLKNVMGEGPNHCNQPSGGLAFETHGHYGSTVFDPIDGSMLELNLCDPCVTKGIERGAILEWSTSVPNESEEAK